MGEIAEDKTHPAYHMGYGNRQSLDKSDIPAKVKQFYDTFYSKNKVNLLTIGQKSKFSMENVAKNLDSSLASSSMKDKSSRDDMVKRLGSPAVSDDMFVFLGTKADDHLIFLYQIDIDPEDLNHLTFLKVAFNLILNDVLIRKHKLALKVDIGTENLLNFAKLEIDIFPTVSGKKSPALIMTVVEDLMDNIYKYLKAYDQTSNLIWKEYMLVPKGNNVYSILSPLLKNFWYYGLGKMFAGHTLLGPYQGSVMGYILRQLKEKGRFIFFVGDFDTETNFSNDYSKLYTDDLTRNTKLGAEESAKSALRLDKSVTLHGVPYAFFRVARSKNRETIFNTVGSKRLTLPDVLPSKNFIPTDQVMNDLISYKASNKYQVQPTKQTNFTEVVNDKYNLPSSSLHMLMNFDLPIHKDTYLKVGYWMCVIKYRLIPVVIDSVTMRNQIGIEHDTTGLKLAVNALPGVGVELLTNLTDVLKNLKVTKEEHEFALDYIYKKVNSHKSPFDDAKEATARFIYVGSPTDAEKKQWIKDNAQFVDDKLNLKDLKIGKVHLEYAPNAITFDQIQAQLKAFEYKTTGFANVQRQLPADNEHVLIRIPKTNPAAANNGYLDCHLMGQNQPKGNAIVFILNRLFSGLAFQYLRTEKSLGYVASTLVFRMHTDIALCLVVMGDKSVLTTETEMDKFWVEANNLLTKTTEDQVKKAASLLLEVDKSKYESLNAEALDLFNREIEGNSVDFKDNFTKEMQALKKQDLVDAFDTYFKKTSKRILAQAIPADQVKSLTVDEKKVFNLLNPSMTIKELLNA